MKHADTDDNNNELNDDDRSEDDRTEGGVDNAVGEELSDENSISVPNRNQILYKTPAKTLAKAPGKAASGRGAGAKSRDPPIYAENVTHTLLDDSSNSRLNPVIAKQAQRAVAAAAAQFTGQSVQPIYRPLYTIVFIIINALSFSC